MRSGAFTENGALGAARGPWRGAPEESKYQNVYGGCLMRDSIFKIIYYFRVYTNIFICLGPLRDLGEWVDISCPMHVQRRF